MRYLKIAGALWLILIAASLASTAQPGQSHNLSEIDPIDVDLNMSNYGVYNASHLELKDGLNFSGYTVYDQGNVEILNYDDTNSEWKVKNSDLNLSGNNITSGSEVCLGDEC